MVPPFEITGKPVAIPWSELASITTILMYAGLRPARLKRYLRRSWPWLWLRFRS